MYLMKNVIAHVTILLVLFVSFYINVNANELCETKNRVSYTGYAVYRSIPQTQYQIDKLTQLMNEKRENGLEFWTEPRMLNGTVDIMVSPDEEPFLREQLRLIKIPTRKIMHDVEDVIKRTSRLPALSVSQINNNNRRANRLFSATSNSSTFPRTMREALAADFYYTRYSRYSMIEEKLKDLAKDSRVKVETIGKSTEGRDIYIVKISKDHTKSKPIIFIDGGHHSREWISHATSMFLIESLINDKMPSRKRKTRSIENDEITNNSINKENNILKQKRISNSIYEKLNNYDFWFIPVVNPDGYEYSHITDRNWRKTRSKTGYCFGVDPNRNYPYHWAESGVSFFTCADTYPGKYALSEPEVAVVADTLYKNKDSIKMYISLHAYSQMLLAPYGYDRVLPGNYDDLTKVGQAAVQAIYSVRGTQYKFGTSAILLYPAAGGSDDYAYGTCSIKYSYTLELPDVGEYGFLLPPEEIIPVGEETAIGLTAMINAMDSIP